MQKRFIPLHTLKERGIHIVLVQVLRLFSLGQSIRVNRTNNAYHHVILF